MTKISIVTSLYNSAPHLGEFYRRTRDAVQKTKCDYEFIFVNDGSPDDSLHKALEFIEDQNVKIIDLSKNFGQHQALIMGLQHATGDFIFMLDSDLEEAPESLIDFYQLLSSRDDVDVVYGVRKKRHDPIFLRFLSKSFYYFFYKLTGIREVNNILVLRLMTRRYVDALLLHNEKTLFISGLFHLTGFTQIPVTVEKTYKGYSDYSYSRRIFLALDAITSFSSKPLNYIAAFGFALSVVSVIFSLAIIYKKIVYGIPITGWASLAASMWLIGGLILFSIGTLGIYISKIFNEVKNRPLSIVKKIYSKDDR